jgi:NAD(P)H-dependent FMN reductase
MHFLIYLGSARQGNYSQHVAKLVLEVLSQRSDTTAEIISPASLGITFNDEGETACPPEFRAKVEACDGLILVAPEYNHGYSGSLKYLLDLNFKAYMHKPVGLVGVSEGPWGGTRVIELLLHPLRKMKLVTTFADVNVTNVQKEVINGVFINKDQWVKRVNRMLDELLWMAQVLKNGREQVPVAQPK